MARYSYRSRAPRHNVWQSPARSPALMLEEIRTNAQRGSIVQVIRAGGGAFEIVKNGDCWRTRSTSGDALATMDTVGEAVMAGNRHLDAPPPEDDDFLPEYPPRGAA